MGSCLTQCVFAFYQVGDMMVLKDHINLPGFACNVSDLYVYRKQFSTASPERTQ